LWADGRRQVFQRGFWPGVLPLKGTLGKKIAREGVSATMPDLWPMVEAFFRDKAAEYAETAALKAPGKSSIMGNTRSGPPLPKRVRLLADSRAPNCGG